MFSHFCHASSPCAGKRHSVRIELVGKQICSADRHSITGTQHRQFATELNMPPFFYPRSISQDAFDNFIYAAAEKIKGNVTTHGTTADVEHGTWKITKFGLTLLLSKSIDFEGHLVYGEIGDAVAQLRRAFPSYGYRESSLRLYDLTQEQGPFLIARGFIARLGSMESGAGNTLLDLGDFSINSTAVFETI